MQSFLHLLAWIGVGIFALLCAHAAFKFKQSEGAGRLNDAFTSIGGGTFSQQITTKVRRFFWGIMLGVYGLLGFGCFALTGSVPIDPPTNNQSNQIQSTTSENENSNNYTSISKPTTISTPTAPSKPSTAVNSESAGSSSSDSKYEGDDPIVRARLGLPPKGQ